MKPARSLLGWLDDPATDRGLHTARSDGGWDFRSYADLAVLVERVAAALVAAGIRRDDVVCVVQDSGVGFAASLFGVLRAGATPSPVAPPVAFQQSEVYEAHLAAVCTAAAPALVLCDPGYAELLAPIARRGGARTVTLPDLLAGVDRADPVGRDHAGRALVQFTSGSGGVANGVEIPYAALEANVESMRQWLRITPETGIASWLPVHHDMGLIGCLVTPVVQTTDLWLFSSAQFVRSPARYARCLGSGRVHLSPMPSFGLSYLARRVSASDLDGCDFGAVRALIVGAERVDGEALRQVHDLLGPFGLRREAFRPAYGLAEATLAVTGLPLDEPWSAVTVDPDALVPGRTVAAPPAGADGLEMVSCGPPLAATDVRIVDEQDRELPEGHVGEIVVRGASLGARYLTGGHAARLTRLAGGVLWSGDAGFLQAGELYVIGRLGDSLKVRGRTVFAEDLEAALARLRTPARRCVVALGVHSGTPTALVVFEQARPEWLAAAPQLLASRIEGIRLVLADAARGTVEWTSSGKPKRRLLWQAFRAGELPVDAESVPAG